MDIVSVLVVVITTMLAFVAAVYAYGMSNLEDIKENWVKYRCNPLYMPLAGMVGSDIATNFMNCSLQSVNTYAGFVMDPVYANFKILTDTVQTILGSMNEMRGAVVGASNGFMGIIASTYGKIHNSMNTTVQLVSRVRSIMNRMIATFAIMMNIVSTGVATGESVANGPIGKASEFLCFSPLTQIETAIGSMPMHALKPGMRLKDGQFIQSVLRLSGEGTSMYTLGSVHVSGNHKVLYKNKWIRVEHHPDALPAEGSEILCCLNTELHTIPIDTFVFKDYEETDNVDILGEFFRRVEKEHGTIETPEKTQNPLPYRYTGVRSFTHVMLEDDTPCSAIDVRVGSVLKEGGKVIGILAHYGRACIPYKNALFAPGTWVVHPDGVKPLIEGVVVYPKAQLMFQYLTENGKYVVRGNTGEEITILDDQETTNDEIHTWRDNEIQKEEP
jgi:hypothetical protein